MVRPGYKVTGPAQLPPLVTGHPATGSLVPEVGDHPVHSEAPIRLPRIVKGSPDLWLRSGTFQLGCSSGKGGTRAATSSQKSVAWEADGIVIEQKKA